MQRTIYVPDELWIPFQKQSIDRKKSVSDRIRDFIESELSEQKGDLDKTPEIKENGNKKAEI